MGIRDIFRDPLRPEEPDSQSYVINPSKYVDESGSVEEPRTGVERKMPSQDLQKEQSFLARLALHAHLNNPKL